MPTGQRFAIIPAAGNSLRMGQEHKLLLPWGPAGTSHTVIDQVLAAWGGSRVDHICVVLRADDWELQEKCLKHAVDVITPTPAPKQMKESIQYGLRHLMQNAALDDDDVWLIAPADLPTLTSELIDSVCDSESPDTIVVPRFGDSAEQLRAGHPVAFPGSFAESVFGLRDCEGLNSLVERGPVSFVNHASSLRPRDIDTPEEYRELLGLLLSAPH